MTLQWSVRAGPDQAVRGESNPLCSTKACKSEPPVLLREERLRVCERNRCHGMSRDLFLVIRGFSGLGKGVGIDFWSNLGTDELTRQSTKGHADGLLVVHAVNHERTTTVAGQGFPRVSDFTIGVALVAVVVTQTIHRGLENLDGVAIHNVNLGTYKLYFILRASPSTGHTHAYRFVLFSLYGYYLHNIP